MKLRRIVLLAILTALVGGAAFAQRSSGSNSNERTYELRVLSNVQNARVFINAVEQRGGAPLALTLKPGRYRVTVRADGYKDFTTFVNLGRDVTVRANLEPDTVTLGVTSNVRDATVYIDNRSRGTVPLKLALEPGRYSVRVEAEEYVAFSQIVQLDSDTEINAQLQPVTYRLRVTSNVNDATVLLNNASRGKPPVSMDLQRGRYTVQVTAAGYDSYTETVQLNRNTTINAILQPSTATVRISVPSVFLNSSIKDPMRLFEVYVDGNRQPNTQFTVPAGRRRIRVETGALAVEAVLLFEAGRTYIIEPGVSLNQKQVR